MRKKIFRKGLCATLILAMMAGLCACGGKQGGTESADPALAKQFVFAHQDIDLSGLGEEVNIRSVRQMNDKLYIVADVYSYSENGGTNDVKLLTTDADGTNLQTIELEKPAAEERPEVSAPTTDSGTGATPDVGIDNGMLRDAVAEPAVEDIAEEQPVMEPTTFYEYTGYNNYVLTDEILYAVRQYSFEDYNNPNNSKRDNSMCAWDMTGKLLWMNPIEELNQPDVWYYVNNMIPGEDGSAIMLISEDMDIVKVEVSPDGSMSAPKKLVKGSELFSKGANMVVNEKEGTILLNYYNEDWTEMYLTTYDPKTDTATEELKLPESFMRIGFNNMAPGASTDMVFTTNDGVFTYNVGDAEPVQILNYVNSDLNVSNLFNISMQDDEHFIACYYDNMDSKSKAAFFTKRNPEDIPDKKVLVLAGSWVDWDLKNRVFQFNKESEEYRIIVKEYNTYNTAEDWMASYTQLNNDILAGNMPDILMASDYLPMESYINKGLIADVGKLIEQDEELSQTAFMENVFDAYRVNEKLYYVIPGFSVRSMIGKTSFLGDRTSWNMQEFMDFVNTLPEETKPFGEITRDTFIYMMMQYCGNEFVDVSTGKCNFDSEEFIAMLEFAKTLPKERPAVDDYEQEYMDYQSQYRENRTVLLEVYLSNFTDQIRNLNGLFDEEVNYIGFPSASGERAILSCYSTYALSAKSKNLDGAWEFLRYYLTEEYQGGQQYNLPTNKKVFDEMAKNGMQKPFYIDGEGNKVEYDMYFDINGESVILDPLSQEQVDQLVDVITSAKKKNYSNTDIENIINEETAAFFEGQKSAKDVAQIIQSRAQIFVDEHR